MTSRIMHMALAAALMAATGCDKIGNTAEQVLAGRQEVVTVALVDRSRSIDPEDRKIYLASLARLGEELDGGDRLMIAAIGDQSRATFRPVLDLRIERTSVRLDQEDLVKAAKAEMAQKAPGLLAAGPDATNSRILEAIKAATEAFGSVRGAKCRLIVLSDGVENSEVVNLDRDLIGPQQVKAAIERARALGLLPDLTGVELSIIGVGGRDFQGVEAFWRAYAEATHADLVHYGRLAYEPVNRPAGRTVGE